MDLSSRHQGTVFISSRKRKRGAREVAPTEPTRSLEEWQRKALRTSWARCEQRIHATTDRLTRKTLDALREFVVEASVTERSDAFPSLPAALVSASSLPITKGFFVSLFDSLGDDAVAKQHRTALVECRTSSTPDSLIRAIVLGLLPDEHIDFPATLPQLQQHLPSPSPPLIVVLHQIHLLPAPVCPALLQTLIRRSTTLPLVLIMTTATAPGVLREVTPSDVFTGLDLLIVEVPSGIEIFEAVMREVFFSSDFVPDVLIDADTFEELREAYDGVDGSLDGLISSLQYIHLKAFLAPLGVFLNQPPASLLPSDTTSPLYRQLLGLPSLQRHPSPPRALLLSNSESASSFSSSSPNFPPLPPPAQVFALIPSLREAAHTHARGVRLAWNLLLELRASFAALSLRRAGRTSGEGTFGVKERVRAMRDALAGESRSGGGGGGVGAGTGETGWRWNVRLVGKLAAGNELEGVLARVEACLRSAGEFELEKKVRHAAQTAETKGVVELLEDFFSRRFASPSTVLFNEIFYFQALDDLIKVFRPSPVEALTTALLAPHTYLGCACCSSMTSRPDSLPDTSILFARYLESGRLINLYDWFESFAGVLAGEKSEGEREAQQPPPSREEIQARFLRGFHELDFLGFLKGTKRREECCLKTFFMLQEEGGRLD